MSSLSSSTWRLNVFADSAGVLWSQRDAVDPYHHPRDKLGFLISHKKRRKENLEVNSIAEDACSNGSVDLPEDVVSLILSKLVSSSCSLSDYARFAAVCATWRRVLDKEKIFDAIKLPAQLPLLLLQNNEEDLTTRYFYSLSDGKVYNFPLRGHLRNQHCHGSSYGWLLTLVPGEYHFVRLFNPFKSVDNEIRLPSLFSLFPYYYKWSADRVKQEMLIPCIKKAAFSRNPSSTSNDDPLIVMVITKNDDLGFCRLTDTFYNDWVHVYSPYRSPRRYRPPQGYWPHGKQTEWGFEDLIHYKGQFHAVTNTGLVVRLDLCLKHHRNPKATVLNVAQPPPECMVTCPWLKKYLVESSGDLLQVHRGIEQIDSIDDDREEVVSEDRHVTRGFDVFKLMDKKWVKIKCLNGWSLFLGDNASFSLPAYNYPAGCIKPNRIYFTDDHGLHSSMPCTRHLDSGIFNLEDGSFEQRSPVDSKIMSKLYPRWVQLML